MLLALLASLVAPTAHAAPKLNGWMTNPGGTPHPDYPSQQFYCDVGTGEDVDQAKAAALAAVARQVRSEVTTSTSVALQRRINAEGMVVGGGSTSDSRTEVSSYFQRADLIKYVDQQKYKRVYYVYACLNRSGAVTSLTHDIGPGIARFRGGLEQARAAWASKDIAGFTPSYRAAMAAYQDVAITTSIIHTLADGNSPEAALVGDGAAWLSATRSEAMAGVRMVPVVSGAGLSSAQTKAVSEAVQAVLSELGFIVGGRCEAGASGAWEVKVNVEPNATYASTLARYNARPSLAISMRDCARSDAPLQGVIEHEAFKASWKDEAGALDRAIATITSARMYPGVRNLLEPVFPVEGSP